MRCVRCGFDTTDLWAVLPVVIALLQREGRISYRALQRAFGFDDAFLEDVREELVFKRLAVDEGGKGLVWAGEGQFSSVQVAPQPALIDRATLSSLVPPSPLPLAPETDTPLGERGSAPEAERRQLTVVFCDVVGSTALSGQLDPEDLREVIQAYQAAAAAVIARFDGHIAQYLGDGLLVYFGYPRAHEDDARRAVQTGLEVIAAMGTLNMQLEPEKGVRLAVRLGIHTGLVVVGEIGSRGRREQLALGETPNVAARLQGLAEPNTVVISATTARLVRGAFVLEDLGTQSLKGMADPLAVARVVGPIEERSIEEPLSEGVLFLVGRDEEIGLLRRRWEQSKEGLGQVVLISGEAGIGKSSLVEILRRAVWQEGCARMTFRCSSYHQNSALYPIIEHLQRLLQWQREESPEARLTKLEQLLDRYSLPLAEAVPVFAALLSLPLPEGRYPPLHLSPQKQKQQLQDAVVAWLIEEAEHKPVQVTWEDVHWADPSTLDVLGLVIDQTPTVRMLNVLTYRPEFTPPWLMRSHMTPLTLNRLERPQVEAMVTHLAGDRLLPAEVRQHVVSKTDGVPLFVEELTKMIIESGILKQADGFYELTGPLSAVTIPSTLQDSLMARLDRLPEVREVAQLGAVLGREFAYEMLKALTTMAEAELQERLAKLVEAELLYQRGRPPRARYVFKHALVEDVAYASLLKSTRQHYHRQIAQLFEQQFPELVETQPEVVARHYTEAGLAEQATPYWQQAGQRALERSADVEAIRHLTRGLDVLKTLPDTPERGQHELTLQLTLGPALMAVKGFATPEVEEVYARALALCQQVGETPQLVRVLGGLSTFYLTRGEFQTARELGEQLLSLAHRASDTALLVEAHYILGTSFFHLGELVPAREHLEQGIGLYDPRQHRVLVSRYGQDPGVFCRCYMARILWFLGYPDQALHRSQEAAALAHELAHPLSVALAYIFAALIGQLRRESHAAREWAEKAIAVCTEHGFGFYLAMGTILRGWALVEQGQATEGIAHIRQGLTAWRATGSELFRPHLLALLAEAYGKVGRAQEGLAVLADALAAAHRSGKRFYTAELYRLKGVLILQAEVQGPQSTLQQEAFECFRQALEIARVRGAKAWELRAGISLSRLWQQQGKKEEACQLLAEVSGWFTEGFDTPDLQEAQALLEELA